MYAIYFKNNFGIYFRLFEREDEAIEYYKDLRDEGEEPYLLDSNKAGNLFMYELNGNKGG